MRDTGQVAHNEYHPCACSPYCTDLTKSRFAPGHDQKLIGYLKLKMENGLTAEEARLEARNRGADHGLLLRLEVTIRRGGFN